MADRKISELTALTTPASGDYLPIVDVSEAAAADKNKRITVSELLRGAPDGTAGAPGFAFESDGDNGMFRSGTNAVGFSTAGSQRVTIDSSGRLLVGTSSARSNFINSTFSAALQVEGVDHTSSSFSLTRNTNTSAGSYLVIAKSRGTSFGSNTLVSNGDQLGVLSFQGSDGTEFVEGAQIIAEVDGTPGANDMPGRLVFRTTPDGASSTAERMRITNAGDIRFNHINAALPGVGNTNLGLTVEAPSAGGASVFISRDNPSLYLNRNSDGSVQSFRRSGTSVGSISVTTTATAYNTSSDYRLKENVTAVTDGITRLQQLKPSRFNFIADPTKTVDGFLAHEVQSVVPEAITGEKDAVDDEGNPEYQGIDQSKLVPLLTAALQEAMARIETLEAKVAALESA